MPATDGLCPLCSPVGLIGMDLLDGLAVRRAPEHSLGHVVGDDRWPATALTPAEGGVESFQRRSQM